MAITIDPPVVDPAPANGLPPAMAERTGRRLAIDRRGPTRAIPTATRVSRAVEAANDPAKTKTETKATKPLTIPPLLQPKNRIWPACWSHLAVVATRTTRATILPRQPILMDEVTDGYDIYSAVDNR